jgi:hypothetical protein
MRFRWISHKTVIRGGRFTDLSRYAALALYQGTTSVVPPQAKMVRALAPANLKSSDEKSAGAKALPLLRVYGTTEVVP